LIKKNSRHTTAKHVGMMEEWKMGKMEHWDAE
jgi:hypothetical protein